MGAQCFMVTDTHRVKLSLRRYADLTAGAVKCPGPYGYHNASVEIGDAPEIISEEGYLQDLTKFYPTSDSRWPTKCDGCDYVFLITDKWQTNQSMIYTADGKEWIDQDLPGGAIREAWWLGVAQGAAHRGPDGKAYLLRLPAGNIDWSIYGPASDSDMYWTITGTLPNITVSPSVNAEGIWHGWIKDGVMEP